LHFPGGLGKFRPIIHSGMAPFPVVQSTLSPGHLAEWLAGKYTLHPPVSCRLFRTYMNHTYLVTDAGRKYILRVYSYNRRTETEITEEIRLLNLLREANVGVSYPVPDKHAGYLQQIEAPEGLRYAVLFSFAEGSKIRHLTEEFCRDIGSVMARFHAATQAQELRRINYSVHTLAQAAYQQAKPYFSESLDPMKFIKVSAEVLEEVFSRPEAQSIRRGVVHLDIWYDNLNISEAGQITLFDFDNCGNGWLVLDIGYFCLQLFYTEPDKARYEKKRDCFLRGYEEIIRIPDPEIPLIPYAGLAIWIYYLGVQAERFDNFANIFLSENYLNMYIGRVREWLAYNRIEIQE
jgi:Ser/Thr protein kinase RdoA (MazF antagonist)